MSKLVEFQGPMWPFAVVPKYVASLHYIKVDRSGEVIRITMSNGKHFDVFVQHEDVQKLEGSTLEAMAEALGIELES